jgi:hypothetical protein
MRLVAGPFVSSWHLATAREVAIPVAIGGKADIAVCDQKRR